MRWYREMSDTLDRHLNGRGFAAGRRAWHSVVIKCNSVSAKLWGFLPQCGFYLSVEQL